MYNKKYNIVYNNDLNEIIEIYLDFKDYSGNVYNLTGTSDCLDIRQTTGDENKQEALLGTIATIKINVSINDPVSIDDLIAQHDQDILVTIYMNKLYARSIFQGFVVVEDNSQPLLDKPFVLQIRATDSIGIMKGVYFLDTNDNPFAGKMSIIGWLAQILYATGQTLNLRTYFNISHVSFNQNVNPLEQTFVDAITFATGTQTAAGDTNPQDFNTGFLDFYSVLQTIVTSFRCKLFQEDGVWNLVSLFEYINPNGFSYYEYSVDAPVDGIAQFTLVSTGINKKILLQVGKTQAIAAVKEDAQVYLKLATKSIEYTYNYDQSLNKMCNQDLTQGAANTTYNRVQSSSIIDPTINPVVNLNCEGHDAFCFTHNNGTNADIFKNPFPVTAADKKAWIEVVLDQLDYELERHLVIESTSTATYLESSEFLLDIGDSFEFQLTTRLRTQSGIPSYAVAFILLTADDGTFYAMNGTMGPGVTDIKDNNGTWFETDSNFRTAASGFNGTPNIGYLGVSGQHSNEWVTVTSAGFAPAITPKSGSVRILICNLTGGQSNDDEQWFKNMTVTIIPFLIGSYKALKGDYNYSTSNQTIRQTIQEVVAISDSPKRYFKGALLSSANGKVLLTPQWQIPGIPGTYRFTQVMTYIIYTHYYRMVKKIEGTMKGFVYPDPDFLINTRPAGMRTVYSFKDISDPTKQFMLTSFDKDYNTCQWRGVFIETLKDQNDTGLKMPDSFIFAYLFQS